MTQIFRRDRSKIETSVVVDRWEEAAEIRQLQLKQSAIEKEYEKVKKEADALAAKDGQKAQPAGFGDVTNETLMVEARNRFPDNQARQYEFFCTAKIAIYAREAAQPGISEERKVYLAEQKVVLLENLKKLQQAQVTKPSHRKDASERPDPGKREDKGKDR